MIESSCTLHLYPYYSAKKQSLKQLIRSLFVARKGYYCTAKICVQCAETCRMSIIWTVADWPSRKCV